MSKTIEADDLAKAIQEALKDYSAEVAEMIKTDCKVTAVEASKALKTTTPAGAGKYHSWKRYQRGWTVTTNYESKDNIRITVHNKSAYRLTHLLEYGHALRNGGRAQSFPHIRQVEEEAQKRLQERIKESIEARKGQ